MGRVRDFGVLSLNKMSLSKPSHSRLRRVSPMEGSLGVSINHTPGKVPCSGVVGQHTTNSKKQGFEEFESFF